MNMSIDGYYLPGYTVETIEDLLQFLDSILTGKSEVWSLLLSFDYEILSQRRVWHNVCMFQLLGGNGFLRQIKRLYYHATSALKVRHCIIRDAEVKMNLAEQILEKYLRQFFFFLHDFRELSLSHADEFRIISLRYMFSYFLAVGRDWIPHRGNLHGRAGGWWESRRWSSSWGHSKEESGGETLWSQEKGLTWP